MGCLVDRAATSNTVNNSVAWELCLGTLPNLSVKKSSVAARVKHVVQTPGATLSSTEKSINNFFKAPKLLAKEANT